MSGSKLQAEHDLIDRHRSLLASKSSPAHTSEQSSFFDKLRCYRVADVASLLGLSARSVERLIGRGELQARKAGRIWVIPAAAVENRVQKLVALARRQIGQRPLRCQQGAIQPCGVGVPGKVF